MTRHVHKELAYDASVADVAAMLADTAFRERVLERLGVLRGSVTVEDGRIRIEQVQSPAGIPSFAQKLVGDEIVIVQEEHWTSPTHGDIEVTIPGKPGEMTGVATLAESGGRTVETVDMDVKVRLPLVGGKVEGLVADMLSKALDAEHRTGVAWLADRS